MNKQDIKRMMEAYQSVVSEKTLTPAEKKKREEIAKAIEKDNPDMPMDKKMAIATAQAKKVAEGPDYLGDLRRKKEREERKKASQHAGETDRQKSMRKVYGKAMGGLKKEETELEEKKMYVVRYSGPDKKGDSSPMSKDAAEARAKRGNAVDKVGGKYTVVAVNAKGHDVKESVDLQEAASPHAKAAAHLEKMVKDPKFARFYGDDIDDLKSIAKDLKSSNPTDHKNAAKAAKNLDTIIRDIVSDAVHKHSSKEASNMWHDHAGMRRLKEEKVECPKCKGEGCDHCDGKGYHQEAMDPVNKKALKKDFDDRDDKDIDNDGDVDGSDEYLHKRRKAVGKAMKKDKKGGTAEISKIGESFEELWTALEEAANPKKGATAPEGLTDKESPKSKEFISKHKVDVEDEEKTHQTATDAGRATKPAPARPGDNKAGDKNIVNPVKDAVKEDTRTYQQKIMDILSGKTWGEIADDVEELKGEE